MFSFRWWRDQHAVWTMAVLGKSTISGFHDWMWEEGIVDDSAPKPPHEFTDWLGDQEPKP